MPKVGNKKFAYTLKGKQDARKEAAKRAKAEGDAAYRKEGLRRSGLKDTAESWKAGFTGKYQGDGGTEFASDRAKRFAKIRGAKTHKGVKVTHGRYGYPRVKATKPTEPKRKTMSERDQQIADVKALRAESKKERAKRESKLGPRGKYTGDLRNNKK